MIDKIDLDELEATARDSLSVKSKTTVIYACSLLALIARIRELEIALGEACRLGTRGSMWDSDIKRLRTILERGMVLP